MYNSTQQASGNDRFSLYDTREDEIIALAKQLHFSVDDVLSAVQEVGFDADAIEEYIRDRYNRA